ncbi:MAG: 4-hydroxythreonine-4-phosphate dehydrogenase PdxA [Verrucomicrobiales bacterium]|nr:4-hydroxythreonine-4-phosphate dehydrogenase PdxA [Verrucomicrobiales bacterium]|tara:strand:- start:3344 stop:4315 length:972 start_codon:yes stop_codon:yes gene_type:complete
MGDPAGIGPEVCLHLLKNEATLKQCVPIIFGDASVLQTCADKTGIPFDAQTWSSETWKKFDAENGSHVLDLGQITPGEFKPGEVNAKTGRAGYEYIISAINAALDKSIDGITTAPINKEALRAAGLNYPGHTEIFAERSGANRSCMMLTSDELTCSFVTVHVGYHEVPRLLTKERILEVIELSAEAMTRIRNRKARLLACGLNPHAGENGLFGNREEELIIQPALEAARSKGIDITGPLPPDTAFLPERRREIDCFICMYHDQGHIPLKALAFDKAINCTLGLPIIRTSVDHGTACDIAWQGKANPNSLFEATALAARWASGD